MAQTLLDSFMFDTAIGDVSSSEPRWFDSYSGTAIAMRPVGPRTAAMSSPGCSAWTRRAAFTATKALPAGAVSWGAVSGWFNFGNRKGRNGNTNSVFLKTRAGSTMMARLINMNDNSIAWSVNGGGSGTMISTPARHEWMWLALAWLDNGNGTAALRGYHMPRGGSVTMTSMGGARTLPQAMSDFQLCSETLGGVADWDGRVGGFRIYSLNAWDLVYPADLVQPPAPGGQTLHYSTNGSPTGDGLTPATAFSGWTRLREECWYAGVMPSVSGDAGTGDTLKLDTSGGAIDASGDTAVLVLHNQGTSYILADGQTSIVLQAHKLLNNAAYTKTSGRTNIWQTSDTTARSHTWEDGKLLNHLHLNDFANEAALLAALDSTPGAAYSNDTTSYVHSIGSTNPTADGKARWRSVNRAFSDLQPATAETEEASMVRIHGHNITARGFHVGYTMLVAKTNGATNGSYGIQVADGFTGTAEVTDCFTWHNGKHGITATGSSTNSTTIFRRNRAEECSPWQSNSPFNLYMTTGSGNVSTWEDNVCLLSTAVAGQALGGGVHSTTNHAWLAHNNGDSATGQFTAINLARNNFGKNSIQLDNTLITVVGSDANRVSDTHNIYAHAQFAQVKVRTIHPPLLRGADQ